MRGELLKTARRAGCVLLSVIVLFLSYRPVISVLAIAGFARNPTEGKCSGADSDLIPRENMPRPAKSQLCDTQGRIVQKTQKSKSVSPEEKTLLAIQMLSLRAGGFRLGSEVLIQADGESAMPEYLKLFQPGQPGSPHSPPA